MKNIWVKINLMPDEEMMKEFNVSKEQVLDMTEEMLNDRDDIKKVDGEYFLKIK